jgi:hypothetical protein
MWKVGVSRVYDWLVNGWKQRNEKVTGIIKKCAKQEKW